MGIVCLLSLLICVSSSDSKLLGFFLLLLMDDCFCGYFNLFTGR